MNARGILVATFIAICGSASADDLAAQSSSSPPNSNTAASNVATGPVPRDAFGVWLENWFQRVDEAQATQPHWITPLVTVTPRLEEEFRYDQLWQTLGNGATIDNFGGGKGLELIPTTTNEIIVNVPPYMVRNNVKPFEGFGDWPAVLIKQRLLSANEEQGNYIVTAFLSATAPTGDEPFTNNAWLITPTIAGGVGYGDFSVQGTFGVSLPTAEQKTLGDAFATNVAF